MHHRDVYLFIFSIIKQKHKEIKADQKLKKQIKIDNKKGGNLFKLLNIFTNLTCYYYFLYCIPSNKSNKSKLFKMFHSFTLFLRLYYVKHKQNKKNLFSFFCL